MTFPLRYWSTNRLIALFSLLCALALMAPDLQAIDRISVSEARDRALTGEILLIDIRQPEEWAESGVADVAVPLDMRAPDFLEKLGKLRDADGNRRIGFICATGGRSNHLARWYESKGLGSVIDVSAGMHGRNGWLAQGLPVRKPDSPPTPPAR